MHRESPEAQVPAQPLAAPWPDAWTAERVVAALEPLVGAQRRERLRRVLDRRLRSVTVVMDAPHDPHNGAAVVRSCEAFGVQYVHVVERVEPFLLARRIAKGTECWVDVVRHPTAEQAIAWLGGEGYELVAADPTGELVPDDLSRIGRLALVVGNEHDGICRHLLRAAARSVRIPMRGFVQSLNVSVSTAILLEAATRERAGDLGPDERTLLYARGLYRSVNQAAEVLAGSQPG